MGDQAGQASAGVDPGKMSWLEKFSGLKVPGASEPAAPAVVPPLKLGLTKDEEAKCMAYFDAHVSVDVRKGGTAAKQDDYVPILDGKPATEADVAAALMALTSAGFSAAHGGAASGPLHDGTKEDVAALVKARLLSLTTPRVAAALSISPPTAGAAAVPATVPRASVQAALTDFFNKVMAAQKGKSLRVDEPVRMALDGLTHGLTPVVTLVPPKDGANVNPAQFAADIAKRLPDPFPAANLDVLQRISPKQVSAPNGSASDALAGLVSKEVNAAVGLLPKAVQDTVRKAVAGAIASGVSAGLGQVLSGTALDKGTQDAITKGVEAALKQKERGPPMDRQQDGAGSPNAPVQPPPVKPPEPQAPAPDVTKSPEVKF